MIMSNKHVKVLALFLITLLSSLSLISCNSSDLTDTTVDIADIEANTKDTTVNNAVLIDFDGTTPTITNNISNGVEVSVNNGDVVIKSTNTSTAVNYVISGQNTNSSLKIYSDSDFNLILNGMSIVNTDGPAINIQSTKKATITLVSGTLNRLVDGTTYASSTEDQKGTLYTKGSLVIGGNGSLMIYGQKSHSIVADGYISQNSGVISILQSAVDGVHTGSYFNMAGGELKIVSTGDGIEAESGYVAIAGGAIGITSSGNGISTSYTGTEASIKPYVSITGGTMNINTTGEKMSGISSNGSFVLNSSSAIIGIYTSGNGCKGILTKGNATITDVSKLTMSNAGSSYYNSTDNAVVTSDAINCAGNLTIQGGTLAITSSGVGAKDISVSGTVAMNGGTVTLTTTGAILTYNSTTTESKSLYAKGEIQLSGGYLTISSYNDGIKSDASVSINGASVDITTAIIGITAPKLNVVSGYISVVSSGDCLFAGSSTDGTTNDGSLLSITGGTLIVSSTGAEGLDSNGNIAQSGGTVVVHGTTLSTETAFDYNGTFKISGGVFIAGGPNNTSVAQSTSSGSTQPTLFLKLTVGYAGGNPFSLLDKDGNALFTFIPTRASYYFVYSSPSLKTGTTYSVYSGGENVGGTNIGGYYSGGTFNGGISRGSVTLNSLLTTASLE